jgi:Fic family protein
LLRYFDLSSYFDHDPDTRLLAEQGIEGFLKELRDYQILFDEERAQLDETNALFQARLATRDSDILRRERERFTIELAWKSSRIEGNTYSLLETEELLKTAREAPGHAAEEAQMILNHKSALDLVAAWRNDFWQLDLDSVLQVHGLLVSGLHINKGIRRQPVGITGTNYQPPSSKNELERHLKTALGIANEKNHSLEAAIVISAMIAYLQPFSDGNKRTARLIGNAVLLAHNYAALSYRSVDEITYKKAVLLVDEQHSLYWYKRLFLEQFDFACKTYFN